MTNEELVMAKIERDIEKLEDELLHGDFDLMELRDNDTTIHWILCALFAYSKDLQKAGLWADDVPEPVEELTFNLESTINIRVYEITGFDACNFAGNDVDSDKKEDGYPKLTLLNDIVQLAGIGGFTTQEAGFILSNIDMLDTVKLRALVDDIEEKTEWLPVGRTRNFL